MGKITATTLPVGYGTSYVSATQKHRVLGVTWDEAIAAPLLWLALDLSTNYTTRLVHIWGPGHDFPDEAELVGILDTPYYGMLFIGIQKEETPK